MGNSLRKSLIKPKLACILTGILAISFFQIPQAYATDDNIIDKTKVVLNDLVGINIAEYAIYATCYSKTYLKVHPEEVADCTLLSLTGSGRLRATCAFVYGKLQQIFLADYSGTISYNQPTASVLNMAKGFLERYQSYTGNSFYGKLRSMLDNVTVVQALTETSGNVMLKISPTGSIVSFL
jgi:hypothetical protein